MLQRFLHNRTAMFTVVIVLLTALVRRTIHMKRTSSTNLPDFRLNIRLERTILAAVFFRE